MLSSMKLCHKSSVLTTLALLVSFSWPSIAKDRTATGRILPPQKFRVPASAAIDHVNLLIGNGGIAPSFTGGMIPSTGPPFAMTRWVAQTRVNYVSRTPYNITEETPFIHGFQATRQPAIWMGESASLALVPGIAPTGDPSEIRVGFQERGLRFVGGFEERGGEVISPAYYSVRLEDGYGGTILVEQSSTSRVGHLRFTFTSAPNASHIATPYILIDAVRQSIQAHDPKNITFPTGTVTISQRSNEICGSSNERQDSIITPTSIQEKAKHFKGFFCARFDGGLNGNENTGIIANHTPLGEKKEAEGSLLSAYALFPKGKSNNGKIFVVNVRVGTSFISIEQARRNINLEIPDSRNTSDILNPVAGTLEATAKIVRSEWAEKLDRIKIKGASDKDQEIFYTAVVHSLQYPSEQHEENRYYSAYDNEVHYGESYTGYSIWDTYRAAWSWLILFAPERLPGMIRSMLNDYREGGWLPMWKNIVETNIMVGTHADSLIGEAMRKGVTGFDRELAWEAVWKDATMPPNNDSSTVYGDRQENVDFEGRAGLSSVYADPERGWVADDIHSESGSRTLDYAYDDYAAYVMAKTLGKPDSIISFLFNRSQNAPFTLFNKETGFMEARNSDGSWAGANRGWTEGDKWIYSFDVVQAIPLLVEHRGGNISFVKSLEDHFNGGHNQHTNEPSHHIPYLYALTGAAFRTQERVRDITFSNYNNTPQGLSGNEDCGQMSAWYIFSAMGFYPVNPASGEYVIGTPFFDAMTIDWPAVPGISRLGASRKLTIKASGAAKERYIKSLAVNGVQTTSPVISHEDVAYGGDIVFEMRDHVQSWGNDPEVLINLGM